MLHVCGKGTKVVLVPLPPAVARAIDQAIAARTSEPILLNSRGARMDRHAATRRLRRLSEAAGVRITRSHPHMLRHACVTTMLDAGVDLRDVQIASRHADPRTTMRYEHARTLTGTRTTSWPPTWPPAPHRACASSAAQAAGDARHCRNERVVRAHIYASADILAHVGSTPSAVIGRFLYRLVGNQIAD